MHLLMKVKLHDFSQQEIMGFVGELEQATLASKNYYLSRLVLNHVNDEKYLPCCLLILAN